MEDPYSEETKEFVEKQNQISGPYINSCGKMHVNVQRKILLDYLLLLGRLRVIGAGFFLFSH